MTRSPKLKSMVFVAGLLFPLVFSAVAGSAPVTDMAKDLFEKGPMVLNPGTRSPFTPTHRVGEDVEASALVIQGIVYGKDLRMALVSGHIVREGEKIGRYLLTEIKPNEITLSFESSITHLKMDGYVSSNQKKVGAGYLIEFQNAALRDALNLLGKAGGLNLIMPEDIGGRVTLSFADTNLMEALRSILRVNGYEQAQEAGIVRIGHPEAFVGGTDLRTESFRLKYATAKDLVTAYKPLLSDKGSVIADDRTNTLTVKDRDAMVVNIANLIAQIDKRDKQVQIEARIVDANKSFSRSIGIRWGITGQKGDVKVTGSKDVGTNADTTNPLNVNLGASNPTSGIGIMIGKITNALNIEAQLTAAEQKGDLHILSKPTVVTLNNMPAKIRSGSKIYVKQASTVNIGGAAAGQSGLQEIATGIELTVTPQISIDDYIKMKIDAVESEPDFSKTVDGIPQIIDNTASTTVILKDGETTIIGGLFREKSTRQRNSVPGFSSIPILGNLFQSRSRTRTDTELMIFITPKILGS